MSLYDELLKATDNLQDISFSRYGTITNITDGLCSVKEEEQDITHQNVPVLNGLKVLLGDKVVLGFVDNNLYNPIITGVIGRKILDVDKLTALAEGLGFFTVENDTLYVDLPAQKGEIFYSLENGVLCADIDFENLYEIDSSGGISYG